MSLLPKHKAGLSLSGGGYRATAFHLGTLKTLYRLNILNQIEVISTISGGSIIGAYYCLNKDDFNPDFAVDKNLPGCLKLDYDISTRIQR